MNLIIDLFQLLINNYLCLYMYEYTIISSKLYMTTHKCHVLNYVRSSFKINHF